uniref:Uncharacterized protein n=1 Tax=Rhizophora mucronata TaxID=61149 RepID=A0A2P2JEY2_RHIMU
MLSGENRDRTKYVQSKPLLLEQNFKNPSRKIQQQVQCLGVRKQHHGKKEIKFWREFTSVSFTHMN